MIAMTLTRSLKTALAAGALLALGACAPSLTANVQRFQSQLPAPQGQTFTIEPRDAALAGGIEFGEYANLVAAELTRLGYRQASGSSADLVVRLSYGVDNGRERVVREPGFGDPFWGPGWHYSGFYGRPVIVRTRSGYRYVHGFYDPFLFGGGLGGFDSVRSFTVYTSGLDMVIERGGSDERLFEGSAEAVSRTNDLTRLVPNLVEAMFTGFPGNSGERVRITVAPDRNERR
jgi:Domain of unknown function (DUF4136)